MHCVSLCIKHHAGHVLYILPGLHLRGRFCEKHAPFCCLPSQEMALSATWHSNRNLRVVHDLLSNPWNLLPTLLTVYGHPISKWKRNVPKGVSLVIMSPLLSPHLSTFQGKLGSSICFDILLASSGQGSIISQCCFVNIYSKYSLYFNLILNRSSITDPGHYGHQIPAV